MPAPAMGESTATPIRAGAPELRGGETDEDSAAPAEEPLVQGRLSLEIEVAHEAAEGATAEADPRRRAGKVKTCVFLCIMLTVVVAAAFHAKAIEEEMHRFVDWCETLGYGAAVMICLATFLASLAMVPCFPLMLASGILFAHMYGPVVGMLVGTLAVFIGLWTGSVAAFVLGRYVFADFASNAAKESQLLSVVSGMIAMQGRRIVFLARMTPIIPGEIFNYACSAIPTLSACDYAIGCIGSILPVSVWVGAGAQVDSAAEGSTSDGHRGTIIMALNVVGMAVLFFEFRRAYLQYKQSLEPPPGQTVTLAREALSSP